MIPHASKFEIYLKGVRATPQSIRETIRDRFQAQDPDSVTWGRIPEPDQRLASGFLMPDTLHRIDHSLGWGLWVSEPLRHRLPL